MIKDLLEQLAPLDAQIAALRGNAADEESDMSAITAHASELAELAVEEDEILRSCGPLTAEDRVFLARHPDRPLAGGFLRAGEQDRPVGHRPERGHRRGG